MEILVCIKQVPGTNKVEIDPVSGVLKRDGVDSKMNPYDLYALESALRLREQVGGKITVITMGPGQATEIIREAYAMGADHGILVSDRKFAGADVLATSYTLSQAIKTAGHFDIIFCGKQTTDGDTAQVGSEISEFLGIPSATNVTAIHEAGEESITVEMGLSNTVETVEIRLPCLLCVDKGIYQPRLPSYIKKKLTQDREITVLSLADLPDQSTARYGLSGSPTQVQRIFSPDVNDDQQLWDGNAEELSQRLADLLIGQKFVRR